MIIDPTFVGVGLFVGFLIGMTGVGGGAILAPILIVFFGFKITAVIVIDLIFASLTKIFTTFLYASRFAVDWQIVRRLWVGSISSVLIVFIFLFNFGLPDPKYIKVFLSLMIFLSGLSLVYKGIFIFFNKIIFFRENNNKYLSIGLGGFIGSSVSLTSIGAGALGTALLAQIYPKRLDPTKLVGTDIMHAIPVSLMGAIGYLSMVDIDLTPIPSLLFGSIPGSVIGFLAAFRIPPSTLKYIIGYTLIISSLSLMLK